MHPARIAELLQPFLLEGAGENSSGRGRLSPAQLQNISIYIDMILRWNERVNLTAVREPDEIVTRHFGESLFTARRLFSGNPNLLHQQLTTYDQGQFGGDLIDLGSGAGFPGLPIKIWNPDLGVTLIESKPKKATFLREVIRALTLTRVDVFAERAETFDGQACVVTLRAVERLERALPTALRLVVPGGAVALLIGRAQLDRIYLATASINWSEPVSIPRSSNRVLLVGKLGPEKRDS
jgi:16S rRNA (guanine527-N7)-methyltransferase